MDEKDSFIITEGGKPLCTVCEKIIDNLDRIIIVKDNNNGNDEHRSNVLVSNPYSLCSLACETIALSHPQTKCHICGKQSNISNSMKNTLTLGKIYSLQFNFPSCSTYCSKKLQEEMPKVVSHFLPKDAKQIHTHKCKYCGKVGKKITEDKETLKVCGGCQMVWYCNITCQKRDWYKHKDICKKHQKEIKMINNSINITPSEKLMYGGDSVNTFKKK